MGPRLGLEANATARALAATVPTLLNALARRGPHPETARLLVAAVESGAHENAAVDASRALDAAAPTQAEAILAELLGARRGAIGTLIARQACLGESRGDEVLVVGTMLLLGALTRVWRRECWDASDLAQRLAAERMLFEDAVPGSVGVFEELLEADVDPDLFDDVTEIGAQLLERLSGD